MRQHQALLAAPGADHVQGRFAAGLVERTPQHFPVDRDNPLTLNRKLLHEALEDGSEPIRVELTEQSAEGIVARQPVFQLQETAQESLLPRREQRHVDRALPSAQNRAERDHQELMKVVQSRVPASRILQFFPTSYKRLQYRPHRCDSHTQRQNRSGPGAASLNAFVKPFQMRFP